MKLSKDKVDIILINRKMTQHDLAELMDATDSTVSRFLKNCESARKKTIGRIADALQVEVEEITE